MQRLARSLWLSVAAIVLVLFAVAAAQHNPRARRLILKDGTYQLAREWQIQGERVRFYSSERYTWEEMPKDLVDWTATEKFEKERESAELSAEVRELSEEEKAERAAEEARRPEVAPGIRLPDTGGVYMLDTYRDQPQLVEMVQSGGRIEKHTGRNILRAALNPFARVKQTIELPGKKARIQSHNPDPFIYVNIEPEDESEPGGEASTASPNPQRFRIVRLKVKKKSRVVGDLKIAIYGKISEQHDWIETEAEPVSGGWVKVTPAAPLAPGEYALVEMLGERQINLYVWDFGVDPGAPQNPRFWTPVQPEKKPTGTNETVFVPQK